MELTDADLDIIIQRRNSLLDYPNQYSPRTPDSSSIRSITSQFNYSPTSPLSSLSPHLPQRMEGSPQSPTLRYFPSPVNNLPTSPSDILSPRLPARMEDRLRRRRMGLPMQNGIPFEASLSTIENTQNNETSHFQEGSVDERIRELHQIALENGPLLRAINRLSATPARRRDIRPIHFNVNSIENDDEMNYESGNFNVIKFFNLFYITKEKNCIN